MHSTGIIRRIVAATAAAVALTTGAIVTVAAPAAAADGNDVGKSLKIVSNAQIGDPDSVWTVEPDPNGSGQVILYSQTSQKCLKAGNGNDVFWGQVAGIYTDHMETTCDGGDPNQKWYFVPVEKAPTPDANEANRYFYIVHAVTGKCLYSFGNGLHADGNFETIAGRTRDARGLADCTADSVSGGAGLSGDAQTMWFHIVNDAERTTGSTSYWAEWANVLGLAAAHAATACGNDHTDCAAQPVGSDAWYTIGDPALLGALADVGELEDVSVGCGVAAASSAPNPYYNKTNDDVTVSITNTISKTHTFQFAWSQVLEVSQALEVAGGEGIIGKIFGLSGKSTTSIKFQSKSTETWTDTTQDTASSTITQKVRPGYYLMSLFTEQRLTLHATYEFTKKDFGGRLAWTMPVTVSLPVNSDAKQDFTTTGYTTQYKKDCTAGPASSNTRTPFITTDASTCGSATPAPAPSFPSAAKVTTTVVYACPGSWVTPDGDGGAQEFGYQWYIWPCGPATDANMQPIKGATSQQFTITRNTLGANRSCLGVAVSETAASSPSRLASDPAYTQDADAVALPAFGTKATQDTAQTVLTGSVPDATVGEAYSVSLIAAANADGDSSAAADADTEVVDGSLPDGLSLSDDGTISGTPTAPGTYAFTVDDRGDSDATQQYTLVVQGVPAVFIDDTALTATLGDTIDIPLVATPGTATDIELANGATLPDGLALSADGHLTGTPPRGDWTFDVADTEGGSPVQFTLHVDDRPVDWADTTEHDLVAGEPADAKLLGTPGADDLYAVDGVAADSTGSAPQALALGEGGTLAAPSDGAGHDFVPFSTNVPAAWDGLALDSTTGRITGTPTTPGTFTLRIVDLRDLDDPPAEVTLTVHPAGTILPGSRTAELLAIGIGGGIVLLLLAGIIAVEVLKRRRGSAP